MKECCKMYYYYVNTFKDNEPVQIEGHIEVSCKEAAIQKLIDKGIVDSRGYEFLELTEMIGAEKHET